MALRNPFSSYARTGDDGERQALLDALEEPQQPPPPPPQMQARPRTPPPPQQTRELLNGPGGRTNAVDQPDAPTNAFSGDRFADERQEPVYQPPSATPTTPGTPATPPHRYNPQRGYGLMDEYDDPYTRRMEGSPSVGGSAATGASIGGSIVPGAGHVVGGVAGAVAALFAKNAETAMTDFAIEDARQIISQAHQDAFGRDITPEYLDQIVRGQGWQDGDRWMGQDSLAYVLDAFASQAPADRAETAAANAAAATPPAGATPAGASPGGTGGGLPFSGFDFNRAQDPSTSAKDAFAAAAQAAPQLTDTSKAGAEAWFRQHIQPAMEAAGYKVFDVQGDKAWVGAREDPEGRVPVDFLINAGGSNPQIGWQPDSGGGTGAGGEMGDAPADIQGAYAFLKSYAHPGMSRAEMESAVSKAFRNVPGFEKAYAGDVVINGRKIDLITDFEGANPSWSDNLNFVPLHPGGGAGNATVGPSNTGLNLAPGVQMAGPLGRSDIQQRIQDEINRILSGAPPRDELLEAL